MSRIDSQEACRICGADVADRDRATGNTTTISAWLVPDDRLPQTMHGDTHDSSHLSLPATMCSSLYPLNVTDVTALALMLYVCVTSCVLRSQTCTRDTVLSVMHPEHGYRTTRYAARTCTQPSCPPDARNREPLLKYTELMRCRHDIEVQCT